MDKKAYTALNTEDHKIIRFNLKNVDSITFSNGVNEIIGTGELEINNIVRTIPVVVGCKVFADKINCEGENTMQMTGFEVEPPTAMLGSIKTGDQITIDFTLSFVK